MNNHPLRLPLQLLMALAFTLLVITLAGPAAAAPDTLPQVFYGGRFNLTQRDGPDCRFSGAPFTAGEVQMAVNWTTTTGEIEMKGSGEGWRNGLRCGDARGDMYWTAEYTIAGEGTFDKFTGAFTWFGTLDGTGSTEWFNCEENGEPISCPGFQQGAYSYDVVQIDGKITCIPGATVGTIQVLDGIRLPTTGQWFADQIFAAPFGTPLYVSLERGEVNLNDQPVPLNCNFELQQGDRLETSSAAEVKVHCREEVSAAAWEIHYSLKQLAGDDEDLTALANFAVEGDECDSDQLLGESAVAAPALLKSEVTRGGVTVISPAGGPPVEIGAPAAVIGAGAGSHIVIRGDAGGEQSQVASLRGQVRVQPTGSGLSPVVLNPAQQVAVSRSAVGPVIDLQQANLPYISRGE